jgi:hypothetical protein
MTRAKPKKHSTVHTAPATIPRTGAEHTLLTDGGLASFPLLRIAGRDKTLQVTVAQWLADAEAHVPTADLGGDCHGDLQARCNDAGPNASAALLVSPTTTTEDYTQIDLKLAIQVTSILSEDPRPGTGYAGFTPTQRYHFLQWLGQVELAAPAAFGQLYLAHLETALFDKPDRQQAAHQELCRLAAIPTWQREELLWRALVLSFRLTQSGAALSQWLALAPALPAALLGVAFGQLALLGQPLTVDHVAVLLHRWQQGAQLPDRSILQLRLGFLTNALGTEPFAYLRGQLAEAVLMPTPWRTAHRDLRVRLAQPDLRPALAPLLRDLGLRTERTRAIDNHEGAAAPLIIAEEATVASSGTHRQRAGKENGEKQPKGKWQLVLEFGESRSEFFTIALNQATRLPGYLQIMDENRRMIHRVYFDKSEMRRFWHLWEYVQSWSSTQVYLNGKELQKWDIYPYSPHLR